MCGIVGYFGFNGLKLTSSKLEAMRDTMTHRGPDGSGIWFSSGNKIGLAHRRLSIVDLSDAATQPMVSSDGKTVLTFNGEIYNHADIRAELEKEGVTNWQTSHSDTEVILQSYRHWGMDECLKRLRGMFAFALWDGDEQQLYLVRDRVGIKPLYYTVTDEGVLFASEVKALLESDKVTADVNKEALFHYLSFLTTPAPMTLFAGINKLEAATYMQIDASGRQKVARYWQPLEQTEDLATLSEGDVAERIRDTLAEAVALRQMADVPVGTFLSGGIDSSSITALFAQNSKHQVKSFAIGYEEGVNYASELPYATEMADRAGTLHHEVKLTQRELLDFLPQMVWLQDEPVADPTCPPIYYVAKCARDNGIIVCQSGEGGDELFIGYPDWKKLYHLERLNRLPVPRFFKQIGLKVLHKAGKNNNFYTEYLRRGIEGQPVFWGGAEAFTHDEKMRLLSEQMRREFAGRTSYEAIAPVFERFNKLPKAKRNIFNWMSFMDLNLRLPEQLLMRTDKMTMAVSLEARVPFLDHKLVELALSVPAKMRLKEGTLKYMLKKAVQGLIPDNLIHRKKQGLGMPLHDWFLEEYGQLARATLTEFCERTGLLDKQAVLKILDDGRAQHAWYLLNLALWWKVYIAGEEISQSRNEDTPTAKAV